MWRKTQSNTQPKAAAVRDDGQDDRTKRQLTHTQYFKAAEWVSKHRGIVETAPTKEHLITLIKEHLKFEVSIFTLRRIGKDTGVKIPIWADDDAATKHRGPRTTYRATRNLAVALTKALEHLYEECGCEFPADLHKEIYKHMD